MDFKSIWLTAMWQVFCVQGVMFSQVLQGPQNKIDSLKELLANRPVAPQNVALYNELAKAYNAMQADAAKVFAQQVISLSRASSDDRMLYNGYNELASYYLGIGDYSGQKPWEIEKLRIAQALGAEALMFKAYLDLGACYAFLRKLDSTEYCLKKAEAFLASNDDDRILGDYYKVLGLYHSNKGSLDRSLEHNLQAIRLYEAAGAHRMQAIIYNNIGVLFLKRTEYTKAIPNFNRSLKINRQINQLKMICVNLMNLSAANLGLDNIDESIQYLEEALIYAGMLKSDLVTGAIYTNLAISYFEKKDTESQLYYNNLAIQLFKKIEDFNKYVMAMISLADLHTREGNFKESRQVLADALETCREIQDTRGLRLIYQRMVQLDSLQGDFKSSLANYMAYNKITDSVENIINKDKLRELQTKYEVLEKEKEIEFLNSENKTHELRITRQKYHNHILLGGLSIALLIGGGILYQSKIKEKLNTELAAKNTEIEYKNKILVENRKQLQVALDEREILIKEIHHRVKNNLQLVLSLLNLQADQVNDPKVNLFLERSNARITSMVLVHQILYSTDNLNQVNFKEYLQRLVNAIYQSFGFEDKRVTYHVNSDDHYFTMDFTILLGVIVNELVFNAFKHAFPSNKPGHLFLNVLMKNENSLKIEIGDDGIGVPGDVLEKDVTFYGLKIVDLLVRQLKGKMKINSNDGTLVTICFKELSKSFSNGPGKNTHS